MQAQLTKNEASEYLAMARQITALPNSLNLRQARRFRSLAVRHAAANPREPMAELWADHATLVCAQQLAAPAPAALDLREPAPPPIDLREPAPPPIDLREPAPELPAASPAPSPAADSMSPSYSDEVLLAAILHNNH